MRTIKFRAWDKNAEVMEDCSNWSGPFDKGWPFKDNSYIFMQFTGLKDKNGKEIYEGDLLILRKQAKKLWEVKYGEWTVGVDDYESTSYQVDGFFMENKLEQSSIFGKVIGNIYENPELLTNDK